MITNEYTAIYRLRSDGNYSLYMVVSRALLEDEPDFLISFENLTDEWLWQESGSMNFPEVWCDT